VNDILILLNPALATIFVLLQSESPSSKCTKLHTVAASNTKITHRDHSIFACWRHNKVLFFRHIPFMVNHAEHIASK